MKKAIKIIAGIVVILAAFFVFRRLTAPSPEEIFEATMKADSIAIVEKIEAERQAMLSDSVKRSEYVNSLKNGIAITSFTLSAPNSFGGRDVDFHFKNLSDKTIKYLTFQVFFLNAVGDLVNCEIKNESSMTGKVTGPIEPGKTNSESYHWECAIYNSTAKVMELKFISIEYMDGSKTYLEGDNFQFVQGYQEQYKAKK